MSELRCIIAEDESLLRDALMTELRAAWPELDIVAACEDGGSALEEISEQQPDVVFLDIRMPGMSGMDVAQAMLEQGLRSQIVFVTAYDQYAIDAFEKGAVDYLLKPVTRERLAATVQRLKERAARGSAQPAALAELLQQLNATLKPASKAPALTWLTASSGNDTRLIMIDDVCYFRSDNKYTVVMTAEGEALLRKPICELLTVLNPDTFKQIHRSTIVNLKAVSAITRDEFGKGVLRLRNRPETLQVSQPFMTQFRNM